MEKLIKNRSIVEDSWQLLKEVSDMSEIADKVAVPLIVPLSILAGKSSGIEAAPW